MEWEVATVGQTQSTNADVAAAARDGAAEGFVIVADHQTAGRGRLDRSWQAPAGSSLALSALLRPTALAPQDWGWLSLATGLAAADAVLSFGLDAALKWPNDVEVQGLKLAGILVERVDTGSGPAAVIGVGLNVSMTADQLPVPTATSLALHGVDVDRDTVAAGVLTALAARYEQLLADTGPMRAAYTAACSTLGALVQVSLPDGSVVEGVAEEVDAAGRLVVGGRAVTAGDVVSVRR